jgi:hypothetical protein
MFDRRTHLQDAVKTLANVSGDQHTGSRLKVEPYDVVKNFAHTYSVYMRLYSEHLSEIDSQPLDELFDLVKGLEAPIWEAKPIKWLGQDVKKSRQWKKVRALASQGVLAVQSLPKLRKERPIKNLRLSVIYYRVEHVDNYATPEETEENADGISENDLNWYDLREDLLNVLEKHGLTGPDDQTENPHFYLLDDRRNEERYHYVEVYEPSVMTLNWLKDITRVLRSFSGWGVGVKNLRRGYLLIFADRLLVTGPNFRRCKEASSVLEAAKKLV